MKKQIKKIGGSIGITFSKEEKEIYTIQEGDIFDVELMKLNKMEEQEDGDKDS